MRKDMAKLIRLIRHAESAANAGLPTTDPDSIPLTPEGLLQAQALARTITSTPNLIVSSPFERAKATALPTTDLFPGTPFEIWPVHEFTYLSPERLVGTTQSDRKPKADAYWQLGDMRFMDGPGAESFVDLVARAKTMLDRLATSEASNALVFSHGQFIRAVAWFIRHGADAGTPGNMRLFRELDIKEPLPNCASYELELRDGRWKVAHQLGQDGNVKFIDRFCTEQRMTSVPPTALTWEQRDSLKAIRADRDDKAE
jgi:broad specificity phosphatase PhoE